MIRKLCILILVSSLNLEEPAHARGYYFSASGNDENTGIRTSPFLTLTKLIEIQLMAGDTVFLNGGDSFSGQLNFSNLIGTPGEPIVFTSYGTGRAVIDGGHGEAGRFQNCQYVQLINLAFKGAGRKSGNTTRGIEFITCSHIYASHLTISGFQKAGLRFYETQFSEMDSVRAHDNGAVGISIDGTYQKRNSKNISIRNCLADNNPGDPTNLTNHSGNGILAGNCKNVLIEYCTATNNGWDMPRIGNGPVGIWAYEADSVIIQHCLSYRNKTAQGAKDGGGFDLDGGVKNSIIQYCLSYENQGSGYGIFQYAGANPWDNNILRFCVSIDDGNVTAGASGMLIWNDKGNTTQEFTRFYAYHNLFYNRFNSAFGFDPDSEHQGFYFLNNQFISGNDKDIFYGDNKKSNDIFLGNFWSKVDGAFSQDGITDFVAWAKGRNYEHVKNKLVGSTSGKKITGFPENLHLTKASQLEGSSFLRQSQLPFRGIDIQKVFGLPVGEIDFFGTPTYRKQPVPGIQLRK